MANRSDGHAHIKIKFIGDPDKITMFNYIMSTLDFDWPWGPFRRNSDDLLCKECNGYIYRYPNFRPEELRMIAEQVNQCTRIPGAFKIKVRMYSLRSDCASEPETDDVEVVVVEDTPETTVALVPTVATPNPTYFSHYAEGYEY